jgi:hypothetical protein
MWAYQRLTRSGNSCDRNHTEGLKGRQMEISQDLEDTKDISPISRRALLKGVAAVAVTATSTTALSQTSSPLCYGRNAVLNEDTVYPLLAVWLLITSNSLLVPDNPAKVDEIARQLNMNAKCVQDIIDFSAGVGGSNDAAFSTVRQAFNSVVIKFSPVAAPYSGGQCPKSPTTITHIGRITPSVSETRQAK